MIVTQARNYRRLDFPGDFPLVRAVPPNEPWQRVYTATWNPFMVYALDVFFGHDRGDRFEMGLEVYSEDGSNFLGRRIEESEVTNREASRLYPLPLPVRTRGAILHVVCRVTGPSLIENPDHPSYRRWRANFDLNVVFLGMGA